MIARQIVLVATGDEDVSIGVSRGIEEVVSALIGRVLVEVVRDVVEASRESRGSECVLELTTSGDGGGDGVVLEVVS